MITPKRENRIIVPLALASAIALVSVWFPFSTLMGQSAQLTSTSHQIAQLRLQSHQLEEQHQALSSAHAATLLAREEYQLVRPGERIIQVLTTNSSGNSLHTGDPGDQPLVAPADASGLLPGSPSDPAATVTTTPGFWDRVGRTLQFWR